MSKKRKMMTEDREILPERHAGFKVNGTVAAPLVYQLFICIGV